MSSTMHDENLHLDKQEVYSKTLTYLLTKFSPIFSDEAQKHLKKLTTLSKKLRSTHRNAVQSGINRFYWIVASFEEASNEKEALEFTLSLLLSFLNDDRPSQQVRALKDVFQFDVAEMFHEMYGYPVVVQPFASNPKIPEDLLNIDEKSEQNRTNGAGIRTTAKRQKQHGEPDKTTRKNEEDEDRENGQNNALEEISKKGKRHAAVTQEDNGLRKRAPHETLKKKQTKSAQKDDGVGSTALGLWVWAAVVFAFFALAFEF